MSSDQTLLLEETGTVTDALVGLDGLRVVSASFSTKAPQKTVGGDAYLSDPMLAAFAVADGVSSRRDGDASAGVFLALLQDWLIAMDREAHLTPEGLVAGLQQVNGALVAHFSMGQSRGQPGCCATGLVFSSVSNQVLLLHCGDTQAYRVNAGGLDPLTNDDARFVKLPKDASGVSKVRKVLTKAFGIRMQVAPHVEAVPFEAGDRFLLCSDGVTNAIGIEALAEEVAGMTCDVDQAVSAVRQRVERRLYPDDATLTLMDVLA